MDTPVRCEPTRAQHNAPRPATGQPALWRALSALGALLCALGLMLPDATAQDRLTIPEPLKPWVAWTMADAQDTRCAQVSDTWVCDWPGEIAVVGNSKGATFTYRVWVDAKTAVRLPGDETLWPQQVRDASGAPVVVYTCSEGTPKVDLERGEHVLSGSFAWPQMPQVVPLPPRVGRVALTIDDAQVQRPRLDNEGRLWLREGAADDDAGAETDSLRVSVYRRVQDGVPMEVNTRLQLNVSGRAREVVLKGVLLDKTRHTNVSSPLPTRITPDGSVKVYVKPGTHTVAIASLVTEPVGAITAPTPEGDDFDPQEVWTWEPNEALRSVQLSGLQAVDAERTSLPQDWRGKTTFLAEPGQTLTLKQTRRGADDPPPNLIYLDRTLWLDLDGEGFSVRDRLDGTLQQGWRLNHGPSGTLGRVSAKGDDLLITSDADTKLNGVELRASKLNLQAELRVEDTGAEIPIVGWDHDVQRLSARLHLPPGWELLGGHGVDQMRGTWIDSWNLFDFFFVLMVALAMGKLCGWRWTPLAILALVLSHGQGDAPRWIWIQLLATLALVRALPEGWFRRGFVVYRGILLLSLAIVLAPYARDQVRVALHPQVSKYGGFSNDMSGGEGWGDNANTMPAAAPAMEEDEQTLFKAQEKMEVQRARRPMKKRKAKYKADKDGIYNLSSSLSDTRNVQAQLKTLQQVDPNAVVQTGPGLPQWSWNTWELEWTGPVRKDHTIRLWILSPDMNRALTFLRVALLIAMALLLIARRDMIWRREGDDDDSDDTNPADDAPDAPGPSFWGSITTPGSATKALLAAALSGAIWAALAASPAPAAAQHIPDDALLDALRTRILAEAECDGPCVTVSRADIKVEDLSWTMTAEVHAQRDSAWALPGPADPLRLVEINVDETATRQLRREADGLIWVRLKAGRHVLRMQGKLANRNVVTVQFSERARPRFVAFTSDDWSVDGISPTGVPDNSLQLTRLQRKDAATAPAGAPEASNDLPPWYNVERTLRLGMPWQLITTVTRNDAERPQLVKLPLIEGESLISEQTRVEDGQALVDFPRGVRSVSYTSELAVAPTITLKAPEDQPWTERWHVECSRIWRCAFDKLPPVKLLDGQKSYAPTWRPWPGETLNIAINRPEGTPGQASTVDRAEYAITPGKRLLRADLTLSVRASQGGWQKVTLPEGAELQTVTVDNKEQSIRPDGRAVNLPLKPGKQTFKLTWQQPWERSVVEPMPAVDIGSKAVNVNLVIHRGADRWLLWTSGPDWGPAILFWSHLLILLVLAMILGRLRGLPLKTWEWLLLVLGIAQLPVIAMVPIVGWFALLAWRGRVPRTTWWHFNLLQVGLVVLTLITVISLYAAIHTNLLVDVDMQVRGAQSSNSILRWYVDQGESTPPTASIVSIPILIWRVGMLLWALWLVARLLKWVPWGWRNFSTSGLWRSMPRKAAVAPAGAGVVPHVNITVDALNQAKARKAAAPSTDSAPPADAPEAEASAEAEPTQADADPQDAEADTAHDAPHDEDADEDTDAAAEDDAIAEDKATAEDDAADAKTDQDA